MEAAVFVSIFVSMMSVFALTMTSSRQAEERARERRMAGHRMNARLLRFDI